MPTGLTVAPHRGMAARIKDDIRGEAELLVNIRYVMRLKGRFTENRPVEGLWMQAAGRLPYFLRLWTPLFAARRQRAVPLRSQASRLEPIHGTAVVIGA